MHALSVRQVPDANDAIRAGCCRALPIGTDGTLLDLIGMDQRWRNRRSFSDVPYARGLVAGASARELAVVAQRDAPHRPCPLKHLRAVFPRQPGQIRPAVETDA